MLHDLTLIEGGSHPRPADPRVRAVAKGNLVHILRPSNGFRPPDPERVLDTLKACPLTDEVRHLARYVLPVFVELTEDRFARSPVDVGFAVSLSTDCYDPKPEAQGLRRRMEIPNPDWTVVFRGPQGGGLRYHLHLPPMVGERVVVPIARLWGPSDRLRGVRNLVTFERQGEGWLAVDHHSSRARARVVDSYAFNPVDRPGVDARYASTSDGAPHLPGA
jgi:hypothetical protein